MIMYILALRTHTYSRAAIEMNTDMQIRLV